MSGTKDLSSVGKVLFWTFRIAWTGVVVAIPLVGVWVASSIAAYLDGPIWLACIAGLLLFPGLPWLWQAWAERRLAKKLKKWHRRVLTTWDKIVLRTLFVNGVFLFMLLWRAPETAFAALSTRGDWMLDSIESETVEPLRGWLLKTADGLQWLYDSAHRNEFAALVDPDALEEAPPPPTGDGNDDPWTQSFVRDDIGGVAPVDATAVDGEDEGEDAPNPWGNEADGESGETTAAEEGVARDTDADGNPWERDGRDDSSESDTDPDPDAAAPEREPVRIEPKPKPKPKPKPAGAVPDPGAWPLAATVHPVIVHMPAGNKASLTEVGQYIARHESDSWGRVKAIHDFAATHVAYDAPALARGEYPPQDAETVLRTGLGVCAGYANLAKALGDITGEEIVVVLGDSRDRDGGIAGGGHAWNAAHVGDRWALFDATWDAGNVDGATFTRDYHTGYLFVPPGVMGVTHFPEDPGWQLRAEPISRGEFTRQPMMRPRFFYEGFRLVSPRRSQVDVRQAFVVKLANPGGMFVNATFQGANGRGRCRSGRGNNVDIRCEFPADGSYTVDLFSNDQAYGTYDYLGAFSVHRR